MIAKRGRRCRSSMGVQQAEGPLRARYPPAPTDDRPDVRRQAASQVLHQQAKRLRVLKVAEHVHLVLGVVRPLREQSRELGPPRIPTRFGEQRACIEQLVEQQRMLRQVMGGPRGRTHEIGQSRQQGRVLDDERQVGTAPRDGCEQR